MARINIVNADNKIESNPRRAYFKLKNTGGPKGDTGAQGPQGPKGDTGAQGPAGLSASVTVGSTTTLAPGASATVTNSGDTRNAVLNFGIPTGAQGPQGVQGPKGDTGPEGAKGAKGDTGAAATVTVANTNTGAPGTNASVENVGDEHNAVLNFTIPRGDKGETGATGAQGPAGQDGKDFTPTVVTALPETGENGVLYMTEKAHTTQTATGNPITATITDEAGKMEAFQLDGDTEQQSYTGKNLFNFNAWKEGTVERAGVTWSVSNNESIVTSGTSTGNFSACFYQFTESAASTPTGIPAGTYYAKLISDSSNLQLYGLCRQSGTTVALFDRTNANSTVSFSIDSTMANIRFRIVAKDTGLNCAGTSRIIFSSDQSFVDAGAFEPYVGGTPSPNPDYPQPVRTVTGTQTVEIFGKNLAHFVPKESKGYTPRYDANTGTIYVSGTNTDTWSNIGEVVAADIPAGTYTISVDNPSSSFRYNIRLTYADNTYVNARLSKGSTSAQVTVAQNVVSMYVFFDAIDPSTTLNSWAFKLQLEAGSTATMFTPYSKQALSLDLGSIELCKLGTYQDYIYKDGESWKVHKETAHDTRDVQINGIRGNTSLDTAASTKGAFSIISSQSGWVGDYATTLGIATLSANIGQFKLDTSVTNNLTAEDMQDGTFCQRQGANDRCYFKATSLIGKTGNEVRAILAPQGGVNAWWGLQTPTETTITDTNLIAQLEAIRTALLQNGANTITNTAAGSNLAGDMEIGYYGYTPTSQYDKWLWLDVGAAGAHYEQI